MSINTVIFKQITQLDRRIYLFSNFSSVAHSILVIYTTSEVFLHLVFLFILSMVYNSIEVNWSAAHLASAIGFLSLL